MVVTVINGFGFAVLQEAMKCANLLVTRAQAAIPAEAVVAAANEGGLLLKREGKWVLDRSLITQV